MTGPGTGAGAGQEHEPDDVETPAGAAREGDYTDKDVTEDDQDTPPGSYVSRDPDA